MSTPEAIIAEGIRVYVEGYLDGYGAVEDTPRERAHLAEDIAENMAEVLMERLRDAGHAIVPSGMEIVPKGTSTALGAFANGSVTKQRVLEDIAYVLTGWRYEEPEDTWAAVAAIARERGNGALVTEVEKTYIEEEVQQ